MNQVIILEGPDGAGKTTLANKLAKEIGGTVRHEGPPPVQIDALQYYAEKLMKYLRASKPVVLDRFYLGEHVYGPVARDTDRLGKRGVRMMRRLCRAYGVTEVTCLPDWETVKHNYVDKLKAGDDYLQCEQKLWEVFKRYESLLTLGAANVYDYRQDGIPKVNGHSVRWHESLTLGEMTFHKPKASLLPLGASGNPRAQILLVGERSNSGLDVPFVSMNHSSRYLDEALQEAKISEDRLAFVNAYDATILRDRPRGAHPRSALLKRTVKVLGNPYVVALGKEAQDALIASGVAWHEHLPHPSSHKRFNFKDRHRYAEMLAAAAERASKGKHEQLA